ncbi:DUF4371 domain-containing protein [Aphis craccivora]|uniref:DUF4371 domain-containing protein n=1 Tax=Aphis craccivora TaxID=307492 RepID=A0A6G0YBD8_APHCR|nr:DUF4371 domain-containing protein [Aphis craccivora]
MQNHLPAAASADIDIHSMAHKLNLVIVNIFKRGKGARNVFNGLQASCECVLTEEIEVQESINMAQVIDVLANIINFNYCKSASLVKDIINTLQKNRWSGHFFNELWDNIIQFCNDNNICTNTSTTMVGEKGAKLMKNLMNFCQYLNFKC